MILIGGAIILFGRVASWRIVAGVMIGMVLTATLFNVIGSTPTRCSPCRGTGIWCWAVLPSA
jgi:Na+-transporting NADH:ubiquinone oxidoreductase subunit NqrB